MGIIVNVTGLAMNTRAFHFLVYTVLASLAVPTVSWALTNQDVNSASATILRCLHPTGRFGHAYRDDSGNVIIEWNGGFLGTPYRTVVKPITDNGEFRISVLNDSALIEYNPNCEILARDRMINIGDYVTNNSKIVQYWAGIIIGKHNGLYDLRLTHIGQSDYSCGQTITVRAEEIKTFMMTSFGLRKCN